MANKTSIVRYQEFGLDLQCREEDGQVWLTTAQLADLYGISRDTAEEHANHILEENELDSASTGKYPVQVPHGPGYRTIELAYWSPDMVLHVGYRVRSDRGVQFRQWASRVLKGEAPALGAQPAVISSARQLLAVVQLQIELEELQAQLERRQDLIEAKLPQDTDYYSIMGYAHLLGRRLSVAEAAKIVARAARLSRTLGYGRQKIRDPRFGEVGIYPLEVLKEVLGSIGDGSCCPGLSKTV